MISPGAIMDARIIIGKNVIDKQDQSVGIEIRGFQIDPTQEVVKKNVNTWN